MYSPTAVQRRNASDGDELSVDSLLEDMEMGNLLNVGDRQFSNIAMSSATYPPRSFPEETKKLYRSLSTPGNNETASDQTAPSAAPFVRWGGGSVDRDGYPSYANPPLYSPQLQRPVARTPLFSDFEAYLSEEIQQVDDLSNDHTKSNSEAGSALPKPSPRIPTLSNLETEIENLEYTRASNVNVSNFVSVKLRGKSNYRMWKAQMEWLMRSHKMLGIIYDRDDWPGTKSEKIINKYETLLTGWLIGSLDEEIINDGRIYNKSVKTIWETLSPIYDPYAPQQITPSPSTDCVTLNYCGENKTQGISNDPNLKELHDATIKGHWWKIKSILKNDEGAAKLVISDDGDTLLHLAVRKGKNNFIKELLKFIGHGEMENKNSEGHTALHIAAIVGNKDAAKLLVERGKELLKIEDHNSIIPVISAYQSKQVNTFVYLWEAMKDIGLNLEEYVTLKNNFCMKFLHTAMFKKQYDLAKKLVDLHPPLAREPSTLVELTRNFPSDIGFMESLIYPSLNNGRLKMVKRTSLLFHSLEHMYTKAEDTLWEMRRLKNNYYSWLLPEVLILLLVPVAVIYPIYQLIHLLILVLLFPCSMLYFLLWKVFAFVVAPINNIQKKRKEYREAKAFLKCLCDQNIFMGAADKFYRGSLMEAARLDVSEVFIQIVDVLSVAMDVRDKDGYNIIQVVVINRSQKVYNLISHIVEQKEVYRTEKDSFENNLLHLAGRLAPLTVLSCTTGAALQLQRELQWRKEVEKLMDPTQLRDENVFFETPENMFSREHANLVKDGENWMKTTAESCSITAALIITIVFAAAITVPGGSNQETGIPLFKKNFAFNIFAVADAISLFSASTSLLVFLSILTTRFAEKDFLISLPRRLIVGLCLLFLSTTAMMLAFSTILFLVFCDERPWMLAPIGVLTCFPIAAIVTLQLPLVIDLYQGTYIPIFGKDEKEEKVQTLFEAEDKKQKGKFRNILRDINPILKRRTACCLPVHRGNL